MNYLLRVAFLFTHLMFIIYRFVQGFKQTPKKKRMPKLTENLLKISATRLAKQIRESKITSEQICTLYINRIKEVNCVINAVVEDRFKEALQDAKNVDVYLQSFTGNMNELERSKPLLGVPLTVKESCSLAGLSLCGGTVVRTGIKANRDGIVVAKLKASGAIPLLVSNTPEVCYGWESNNFVSGQTNNPYDTNRTCGGSSGGEGALLSSGASLIGIGSDIAGSIRLPALFNGIFGHKPTARVIQLDGHYPYSTDDRYNDYLVIGPLTRYSEDLKLMLKIMAKPDILPHLRLDQQVHLSQIRVFYMEKESNSIFTPKVDESIRLLIRQTVDHLETNCNSQVVNYKFDDLKDSCEIAGSTLNNLTDIPNLLKGENALLGAELCKSLAGMSKYTFNLLLFLAFEWLFTNCISNEHYLKKCIELKHLFREKLGNDGVFLYPTFTSPAFEHNTFLYHSSGISYLMIFNALGLPATHIPCGLSNTGLPIGIQVVAAPNQDRLCFAVAEELEKYFGGWTEP